jgi:hypothetical protein
LFWEQSIRAAEHAPVKAPHVHGVHAVEPGFDKYFSGGLPSGHEGGVFVVSKGSPAVRK